MHAGAARLVVLTDLDGTLLDAHTRDWAPAAPVLAHARERGVAVIAVTSRTRAEVDDLRPAAGLAVTAIVENGSAIVGMPAASGRDPVDRAQPDPDATLVLGCTFEEARAALDALGRRLGVSLRSLSAMGQQEVESVTGLEAAAARRAASREFSEAIVPPAGLHFDDVSERAEALGVHLIQGDRFWHLVGRGTDKGSAARLLLNRLAERAPGLASVALGNGPADIGLLEAADIAIVVPGEHGPHPALAARDWRVAPAPGPAGWAAALTAVLLQVHDGVHNVR